MTRNRLTRTSAWTLAAIAAIGAFCVTTTAEAKKGRGGSSYWSKTYETRGPARGYEGFIGFGHVSKYCSYTRYPVRKCFYTGSGRRKCRIVSWRLDQKCY